MAEAPRIRRARDEDLAALAPLLYSTAGGMYDLMAGTPERALRVIAADIRGEATGSVWVAEVDGSVAGAMVAYPYGEAPARTWRFLRTVLLHSPPWRWPAIVRLHWKGERFAANHPPDWLYVDALATDPAHRRQGVATALLEHAERLATNTGLRAIALDTPDTNEPALALYRRAGFRVAQMLPTTPPIPAAVILVKDLR